MEIENNTSEKGYVSNSLRDFFQRILIEHIEALNAKEQIFSCRII